MPPVDDHGPEESVRVLLSCRLMTLAAGDRRQSPTSERISAQHDLLPFQRMFASLRVVASGAFAPVIARQLPASFRPGQYSRVQQHCHRPSVRAMASDEASAAKQASVSLYVTLAAVVQACIGILAECRRSTCNTTCLLNAELSRRRTRGSLRSLTRSYRRRSRRRCCMRTTRR